MWVGYPGGGKNAWNPRGGGKNAWNPRGFIAPNPREVRGPHELRGNPASLVGYYYSSSLKVNGRI